MDARVKRITEELRHYDRDLYATRITSGMIQVYRNKRRWETYEFEGQTLRVSRPNPLFIFALTDTWTLKGRPVEWGLEPIASKIREMDNWRDDSQFAEMVNRREKKKADQERAFKNDIRARAMDVRSDFAQATNDINTSTLEKVDRRRKADGYC